MFLGSGAVFTSQGHRSCFLVPQMPLLMGYDNLETKSLAMRCDLRNLFLGKSACNRDFRANTELFARTYPHFIGVCSDQHAASVRRRYLAHAVTSFSPPFYLSLFSPHASAYATSASRRYLAPKIISPPHHQQRVTPPAHTHL